MRKVGKWSYTLFSWLFVVGVLAQVFLAGLVVVARTSTWENHVNLGHTLGLPLILMLISMYVGGLPKRRKTLTWLLFAGYLFQADFVIFLRDSVPVASALHPVMALINFALGWEVAPKSVANLGEGNDRHITALPATDISGD